MLIIIIFWLKFQNDLDTAFIGQQNQRQSRSRISSKKSKQRSAKPNNKFTDIMLSLKMETLFLEKMTKPLPRLSSPSKEICIHCEHDHNRACCLYFYDGPEDGPMYSNWKKELENPTSQRSYPVSKIPEAISGNTTPKGFPGFSYNNAEFIERHYGNYKNNGIPTGWFRQYYYPLFAMNIIPAIRSIEGPYSEYRKQSANNKQLRVCCNLHFKLDVQAQQNYRRMHEQKAIQPNYFAVPQLVYPQNIQQYSTFSQFQHFAFKPMTFGPPHQQYQYHQYPIYM